jgi:hypothetical protein
MTYNVSPMRASQFVTPALLLTIGSLPLPTLLSRDKRVM